MYRPIKTNIPVVKRSLILAVLLGVVSAANAAPIYTDDFDLGFSTISLPGDPDYTNHITFPAAGFLGTRNVQLANYAGNGTDTFDVTGNGSQLLVNGNGTASGLLQLSYGNNPSSVIDLSGAGSVSLFVASNTSTVTAYLGSYTDNYANLSAVGFTIPAGFSGQKDIYFSNFNNTFDAANADSLFLVFQVAPGSSLALDKFTVNAVPEPASFAALGVGAVALLRRRKRA